MDSTVLSSETLAACTALREAEDRWLKAVLARDTAAADDILHPDYRLIIGIEGQPLRVMPRQQWLALLPDYRITGHSITDRRVSLYGNIAVVVMLWSQTATAPGDRDMSGNFLLTDIWQNTSDGWRVIERHSSRQEKAA
jgi:ketosteroid isomerase-like protein